MRKPLVLMSIAFLTALAIWLVWLVPRVPRIEGTSSASASAAAPPRGEAPNVRGSSRDGGKPGAACLECQKRQCGNVLSGCSELAGNAQEGQASGTPRSRLCEQMLDCARRAGCADSVSIACFCGNADLGSCQAGNGNGACRSAIEAASETTDSGLVFKRLRDKSYAAGVAEPLLTCETRGCADECVPYYR